MCAERQRQGKISACAEACPTEATIFGDREELIKEAHRRIKDNPELYVNHLYGENEAGGTSVLILSNVPFEKLEFPTNLSDEPLSHLTWRIMSKIPNYVMVSGAFLYGIYWIINRRMELAELREKSTDSDENKKITGKT